MESNLEKRFLITDVIIQSININLQFLEYLSFGLHNGTFNLRNNIGLFWIWRNLMGNLIMDLHKIIHDKEQLSIQKIITICESENIEIDYDYVRSKIESVKQLYQNKEYKILRDKMLAHQDFNTPIIKTDLLDLEKLVNEVTDIFSFLATNLNWKHSEIDDTVIKTFANIFDAIDKYD